MSRAFDSMNKNMPEGMAALAQKPPACFDRRTWVVYLKECYREARDNASARRRLERGVAPDYCTDCVPKHRAECVAKSTCHPPKGAKPPALEESHA